MAKTVSVGIRIEPALKAQLDQAAIDENRSITNLIETILKRWLKEHERGRQ